MEKTAGFTLVELIVVIVILGILAGIGIPIYSSYISKANEANDLLALDTVKTAAVFTYTQDTAVANEEIGDVTRIVVQADSCIVTPSIEGAEQSPVDLSSNAGFLTFLDQDTAFAFSFKSSNTKATWENGKWIFG